MDETENRPSEPGEEQASGDEASREADPASGPGPRGNPEADPERVERDEEDLNRVAGN
jgi:hypothetical protein